MKVHLSFLFIFLSLCISSIDAFARRISDTKYRFCIMDSGTITDESAAEANRQGRLPSIFDARWYAYHGLKINGDKESSIESNKTTKIDVFLTEIYDGSSRSLSHRWNKGMGDYTADQTTDIYVIVDAPSGVDVSDVPSHMLVGESADISCVLKGDFTPFSGEGYFDYKYNVFDDNILSIDDGKIMAKNVGKSSVVVSVTALNRKYDGSYFIGSDTIDVEVVASMDPTSISFKSTWNNLFIGQEKEIEFDIVPYYARTEIEVTSKDNNVATVVDGKIKAVATGTTTLTATAQNGLTATCMVDVKASPMPQLGEINTSWGTLKKDIISEQKGNYVLTQNDGNVAIFEKTTEEIGKVYLLYGFDKEDKLCASTISLVEGTSTDKLIDDALSVFDIDFTIEDGMEVRTLDGNLLAIDVSSTPSGGNLVTIGISYYQPLEIRDDCVDLGLSVQWATMNLGAESPTSPGEFYAYSETKTKSNYWRENYQYANNNANQYIFVYTNPTANICGTSYDIATKMLGDGWRMPTMLEATELATKCKWEREKIDGIAVYRVTGPNGNSIIIPMITSKRQDQDYKTYSFELATGETRSKTDEYYYIITDDFNDDTREYIAIVNEAWKAWGYNIRPVYTK